MLFEVLWLLLFFEIVHWEFRYREENVKNADNLQLCVSFPWLGGGKQLDSAPLL